MESKTKYSRVSPPEEESVPVEETNLYKELFLNLFADNDRILEILKRTDVEEALNLYIAVAGDQAFFKVINVMDTNIIWNYWFQRDMAAMYKFGEWDAETVLWKTEDKPTWKVYYLWFRFLVASRQYYLLAFKNKDEPTGLSFRFKSLNLAEIDGRNVDLRKYIPNYPLKIRNPIPNDPLVIFSMENDFFKRYVAYMRKNIRHDVPLYHFNRFKMLDVYSVFTAIDEFLNYKKIEYDYVKTLQTFASKFPTTYSHTRDKIVLATCISCNAECAKPQVEKYDKSRVFCDKDCQRAFYKK